MFSASGGGLGENLKPKSVALFVHRCGRARPRPGSRSTQVPKGSNGSEIYGGHESARTLPPSAKSCDDDIVAHAASKKLTRRTGVLMTIARFVRVVGSTSYSRRSRGASLIGGWSAGDGTACSGSLAASAQMLLVSGTCQGAFAQEPLSLRKVTGTKARRHWRMLNLRTSGRALRIMWPPPPIGRGRSSPLPSRYRGHFAVAVDCHS